MIAQDTLLGMSTPAEAAVERIRAQSAVYEVKVVRAIAVREDGEEPIISRADLAALYWNQNVANAAWYDPDKECMVVFILNRRNRLIAFNLVSLGTATSSLAHPREIFRPAIVASGAAVIIAHNHPSGDPSPSAADIQTTRLVREASNAVDIPILDHVIVGRKTADPLGRGYYSFREAGLL